MAFIEPKLLHRIDSAKQKIDESKVALFVSELFRNLETLAMEYDSIADEDNATRPEEVVADFKNGWYHAVERQDGTFSRLLLTEIAALIEPCQKLPARNYADFRATESYGWTKECYVPPAGKDRVLEHISRMERVIAGENMHPVEEAAFTFLHVSRIQPFELGNKRTANVMMNSLLKFYGFAPVVFKEQQTYRRLLLGAARGFRNDGAHTSEGLVPYSNPGRQQAAFYNHIGEIELKELEAARDELDGLKIYSVDMKAPSPSSYYSAKRSVDSWFRAHNACHQVRLSPRSGNMIVIGNIPQTTLESIMSDCNGLKKYKVRETKSP